MAGFDRNQLLAELPAFEIADSIAAAGPQVQAYCAFYGLDRLPPHRHRFGVARMAGCELAVQLFRPQHEPRGTAVIQHGYLDHTGLYRHLIHCLLQQGWQVLIQDLQGHGLSSGTPMAVDSFTTYAQQSLTLLQRHRHELQSPWVLIGQSTGGAILLEQMRSFAAETADWPVARRILLAPLVRPTQFEMIRRKYRWLGRIFKQVPRFYTENSTDPAFVQFVRERDPLQHDRVSVQWIGAMLCWIEQMEALEQLPGSALIIQGTADRTVAWQHNLPLLERLLGEVKVELIEHARHHLVNEAEPLRGAVLTAVRTALAEIRRGEGAGERASSRTTAP